LTRLWRSGGCRSRSSQRQRKRQWPWPSFPAPLTIKVNEYFNIGKQITHVGNVHRQPWLVCPPTDGTVEMRKWSDGEYGEYDRRTKGSSSNGVKFNSIELLAQCIKSTWNDAFDQVLKNIFLLFTLPASADINIWGICAWWNAISVFNYGFTLFTLFSNMSTIKRRQAKQYWQCPISPLSLVSRRLTLMLLLLLPDGPSAH